MSFILDALKKSETDRQQQSGAEFAVVPTSPQSPAVPRWLWIVGLLLAVNLVVLIGLLLKPASDPPQRAQASIESTVVLPPAKNNTKPSFQEQVAVAQQNPPDQQRELPNDQGEIYERQELVESVLISQNPTAVSAGDLYPSIQEVRASGAIDIPDLHLDIHVFSPVPEDRFVFVNMSKLREGSTLSEGPVVDEITPNGVVLRYQGQHFLLSRD